MTTKVMPKKRFGWHRNNVVVIECVSTFDFRIVCVTRKNMPVAVFFRTIIADSCSFWLKAQTKDLRRTRRTKIQQSFFYTPPVKLLLRVRIVHPISSYLLPGGMNHTKIRRLRIALYSSMKKSTTRTILQ